MLNFLVNYSSFLLFLLWAAKKLLLPSKIKELVCIGCCGFSFILFLLFLRDFLQLLYSVFVFSSVFCFLGLLSMFSRHSCVDFPMSTFRMSSWYPAISWCWPFWVNFKISWLLVKVLSMALTYVLIPILSKIAWRQTFYILGTTQNYVAGTCIFVIMPTSV